MDPVDSDVKVKHFPYSQVYFGCHYQAAFLGVFFSFEA